MASLTLITLFTAAWFAEDVDLWPWVEGSAPDDTPYDRALAPVRALLRDPTMTPVAIDQVAVRALYAALP